MKLTCNHSDCDFKDQSSISESCSLRQPKGLRRVRNQPKNRRIPLHIKKRLIAMVTLQSYRIKDAARCLKISYSTAKKTFQTFRASQKEENELMRDDTQNCRVCKYCDIKHCQLSHKPHICVISTLGGRPQEPICIKFQPDLE